MVHRYIVPELNKLALETVERSQVMALHHGLYESPSTADMVARTLSL